VSLQSLFYRVREEFLSRKVVQVAIFAAVLGLSFLAFWLGRSHLDPESFLARGYVGVFTVNLITCASILFPIPGEAVNIAAGATLTPMTVALVATAGATIGEMTAYAAGILGRKVLLRGYSRQYAHAEGWMKRHGVFAVFLFALIPMLVYDLIGIVAGSTRYHLGKFVAATFAGRFLRCLLEAYLGYSLIHMLPLP